MNTLNTHWIDCFRRRRRRRIEGCQWARARSRSRKRVIDIIYMFRSVSRCADAGIPQRHRRVSHKHNFYTVDSISHHTHSLRCAWVLLFLPLLWFNSMHSIPVEFILIYLNLDAMPRRKLNEVSNWRLQSK